MMRLREIIARRFKENFMGPELGFSVSAAASIAVYLFIMIISAEGL